MNRPVIVSMFDESGNALRPWANAGCACYAFDLINEWRIETVGNRGGFIFYQPADFTNISDVLRVVALRPSFVMGWPDCTQLAVSGTRHWPAKAAVDPLFQHKAVALARTVEFVGSVCNVPWFAENPISRLASMWRKPNYYFSPCDYGYYLSHNELHPRWPEFIPAQDAYEKRTCLWTGNGFVMPPKLRIEPIIIRYANGVKGSPQFTQLGGKSAKTKQIRSETARGFARAVFLSNQRLCF